MFGLIGPNGAGKTSMVDALTGYTRPAAGTIAFDGRDISRLRPYRRARLGLARTFQSVELFDDLTVDENLLVASEHVTRAAPRSETCSCPTDRPIAPVSTGQSRSAGSRTWSTATRRRSRSGRRKLVGVGRALARQPRLVLLDEPAAGLDTDESHRARPAPAHAPRGARRDRVPDRPRHGARPQRLRPPHGPRLRTTDRDRIPR